MKMFKKFVAVALCMITALAVLPLSTTASAYGVESPTPQQIVSRFNQIKFDLDHQSKFAEAYSLKAPYAAGELDAETQTQALNAVNFCRYVAGLPDDVELKSDLSEASQAGAMINAANGVLTHNPSRPSGIDNALYNLGKKGCGSSNIAYNHNSVTRSVVCFMEDTDESNISALGHRRWLLNPSMKYIGVGNVGAYSSVYVFDSSRSGSYTGDYVCWPAKNMPYELYGTMEQYAFSVSLGNAYDTPSRSKVKVTVSSQKLGKSWTLDSSCNDYEKYMNVNNDNYGTQKCIIFNVGEIFPENDTVSVTISGISKSGSSTSLSYQVKFFNMTDYITFQGADTWCYHPSRTFSNPYVVEADCENEGYTLGKCTDCNKYTKFNFVPAKGHSWQTNSNGVKYCSECNSGAIQISHSNIDILNKETATVKGSLANGSSATFIYSSLNPLVASVSSSGVITANSVGSTTIRVSALGVEGYAECRVNVLPREFTVTWSVNGEVTTQKVKEGAPIVPNADTDIPSYKFVSWSPLVPSVMPASNLNFTAVLVKQTDITIINNPGTKTVNYGEKLTLKAKLINEPEGAKVYWYVNGAFKTEGESITLQFMSDTEITVKAVKSDGTPISNYDGAEVTESETVKVKAGFFQKFIYFFKNLFGLIKAVEQ